MWTIVVTALTIVWAVLGLSWSFVTAVSDNFWREKAQNHPKSVLWWWVKVADVVILFLLKPKVDFSIRRKEPPHAPSGTGRRTIYSLHDFLDIAEPTLFAVRFRYQLI